jgi:hypothetical protein
MRETVRLWREIGLCHVFRMSPSTPHPVPRSSVADPLQDFQTSLPASLQIYWQHLHLPVSIVWTYWELDMDIRGEPSKPRMDLWESIIRAKGWNMNHIAFWPLSLPADPTSDPGQCAFFFRKFLASVTPKYILCFGCRSHEALRAALCTDFPQLMPKIIYLPGAEEMLPDNKAAKRDAWRLIQPLVL